MLVKRIEQRVSRNNHFVSEYVCLSFKRRFNLTQRRVSFD